MTEERKDHDRENAPLGVAVITPVGTFPGEDLLQRALPGDKVSALLAKAASELKITNTAGWVVSVDDRDINPEQTFHDARLSCVVEMEYHKPEGGGGA